MVLELLIIISIILALEKFFQSLRKQHAPSVRASWTKDNLISTHLLKDINIFELYIAIVNAICKIMHR